MVPVVLWCTTTVTPTGSEVGISPARGHRVAAARGLVSPLVEKCNGRQFSQGDGGETAPLRAQEDRKDSHTVQAGCIMPTVVSHYGGSIQMIRGRSSNTTT